MKPLTTNGCPVPEYRDSFNHRDGHNPKPSLTPSLNFISSVWIRRRFGAPILDANAVRCSHEQIGAAARRTKSQSQSGRHGYGPLLGGLEHPLLLPRVSLQCLPRWLPFSKRDEGHFVLEKQSRPRCAVADSSRKGLLFVVPVGFGRRPHRPHRHHEHLMRWKCRRFVIIVLPGSEAE